MMSACSGLILGEEEVGRTGNKRKRQGNRFLLEAKLFGNSRDDLPGERHNFQSFQTVYQEIFSFQLR